MAAIVDLQVERVQKMLADRKIRLDLTEGARRWLGRVGYDPVYGAAAAAAYRAEASAGPARRPDPAWVGPRRRDRGGRRGRWATGTKRGVKS